MRRWNGLWLLLWFVMISFVSLVPFPSKNVFGTHGTLHIAGHIFVFGASGVMLLAYTSTALSRLRRILLILLFCASLEALQAVIYHIRFEWSDILIDYFAVAISPLLLYAWRLLMEH